MALTRITKGVIKPNENYDTHNINSTGIITAIGFKGPFTGSSDIQSGIITATQLDLNGNGDISGNLNVGGTLDVDGHTELDNVNVVGVITATKFKGGDFDGRNLNISGIATFAGNVSIAGTLTYEDVTNIDAVGLVTARAGVHIPDNQKLLLGTDPTNPYDGQIYSNGSHVYIQNRTAGQTLRLSSDHVYIRNRADGQSMASFDADGGVDLFYNTAPKFATTNTGISVTGNIEAGSVGIGTTNPTYKLHVDSGDAAIGLWKSRRSSGSYVDYSVGANGAALGFIGAGGQIIASGADSADFAIRSEGDLCLASGGSTERVRINSGGQLVAGATVTGTEGGGAKLCIVGTGAVGANPSSIAASTLATFRMTGAAGHAAGISILAGNGGSSALNFGDSDNELIGRILYNHTSGNATDYMAFYVQGSEKLHITSGGVLGVRTTPEAWHTDRRAIQIGGAALSGQNPADGQELALTNNAYYDTSNNRWEFIANDDASGITMSNGGIQFLRSPSSGTADAALSWNTSVFISDIGYLKTNSELWVGGSSPVLRWRNASSEFAVARITSNRFDLEVANYTKLRVTTAGKITNFYDNSLGASDAQYGQLELQKSGASNADPDWSYLSFHRVGAIAWQQGIDSNDFVIATTGGGAKDTLDAEKLRISSGGGILIGLGNQTKTQDGVLIERNSGDGIAHITAGRSGGNYSGMNFYVAGASGVTLRHQIDYQSNFKWFAADGTTERLRIASDGRIVIGDDHFNNAFAGGDSLVIGNEDNGTRTGITLVSASNTDGGLYFSRGTSSSSDYVKGQIVYNHPNDYMAFYVDSSIRALNIFDTGDISIGNNTKLSSFSSFRHLNIGNNLILNAGTSAGGYTGFHNNTYLNASGNWTRMHNDHTSGIGMDDGNFYFRNAAAGTGTVNWQMPLKIQTDNRINIGEGNGGTPLGAVHINTSTVMGTDTALFIGSNSDNRFMTINQNSSSEQFSHMSLRYNDNACRSVLQLENPYGPANFGTQILFQGYNEGTQAYIETKSEGANNANSTLYLYSSGNQGVAVTHDSGVYIRQATGARGILVQGHSSASHSSAVVTATSTSSHTNMELAYEGSRGQLNFGGHGDGSVYLQVESGYVAGNSTLQFDYSWQPGGNGGIRATMWASHWTAGYDLYWEGFIFGDSYAGLTLRELWSRTSGTQGAWSITRPANSKLRIQKSAGSYGGGMYYEIMMWHPGRSMTLSKD